MIHKTVSKNGGTGETSQSACKVRLGRYYSFGKTQRKPSIFDADRPCRERTAELAWLETRQEVALIPWRRGKGVEAARERGKSDLGEMLHAREYVARGQGTRNLMQRSGPHSVVFARALPGRALLPVEHRLACSDSSVVRRAVCRGRAWTLSRLVLSKRC